MFSRVVKQHTKNITENQILLAQYINSIHNRITEIVNSGLFFTQ